MKETKISKEQTNKTFEELCLLTPIQKTSLLHYLYGRLEYNAEFVEALKEGIKIVRG